MRITGLTFVLLIAMASLADAGPLRFGGFGGMGGFGHHHGGFGPDFGGFGFFGFYDPDFAQSRFEDRLDDLTTEYDEGVAGIDDYYNSDDYDDVVDDTERLSDHYSRFLDGVEFQIGWLESSISHLNDESNFLDELITKYQGDEDLSEDRIERLTDWITRAQDFLTLKIDLLTEKQTNLSENLTTYTDFDGQITTFLDTIVAAGGDSSETTTTATALTTFTDSTSPIATTAAATRVAASAMAGAGCSTDDVTDTPAAISSVPEPATITLIAAWLAIGPGALPRRLRRAA